MHFVGTAPSRKYAELHLSFSSAMFLTLLHFPLNESYGAGEPAPRSVRSPQVVATTVWVRSPTSVARESFISQCRRRRTGTLGQRQEALGRETFS